MDAKVSAVVDEAKSAVNKALGNEVRVWRTRRGLSRSALAAITKEVSPEAPLTPTQIERIENNRRDMTLTQLFTIAWALRVEPQEIVEDAIVAHGGVGPLMTGSGLDE